MTTEAHVWNAQRPPEPAARPGKRIWSLSKHARRIDYELRTFECGAEVRLFVNDGFFRIDGVSLELASRVAEKIRARLIDGGWTTT